MDHKNQVVVDGKIHPSNLKIKGTHISNYQSSLREEEENNFRLVNMKDFLSY